MNDEDEALAKSTAIYEAMLADVIRDAAEDQGYPNRLTFGRTPALDITPANCKIAFEHEGEKAAKASVRQRGRAAIEAP